MKNVIAWDGDLGRGNVADLLGRFQKIDPRKASDLQDELHRQSGERIPFRIAPLAADVQDPTDPASGALHTYRERLAGSIGFFMVHCNMWRAIRLW